jgi:hypothetical protein
VVELPRIQWSPKPDDWFKISGFVQAIIDRVRRSDPVVEV